MRSLKILAISLILSSPFPVFVSFAHSQNDGVSTQSEAVILMDAKSGAILYEKNDDSLMYPASLTKVTTAIVAIEEGSLDELVTVSEKARNIEGTRVYLEVDEQVPLEKLVYGILVSSGNDAAIAIAEHFDGSTEAFAKRMNKFVKNKVGVENTTFENPHGLFSADHITTAYDLAMITKYALKNETFREIFGTGKREWVGEAWNTTIYHHNQLVRTYDGATGGKTGYVDESGNTLITTAEREGTELIAVVMKAPSKNVAYHDTTDLLDFGFENFETKELPANTNFENENNELVYSPEPIYYTVEKGESVRMNVKGTDELVISSLNDDHVLLKDIKLMKKEEEQKDKNEDMKAEAANIDKNAVKAEEIDKSSSAYLAYLPLAVVFLTFIIGVIIYKRKKQQGNSNIDM
jgi:D-alanyl-D-alanine carboxypeptidase (penicillin-binding protein 5/6)